MKQETHISFVLDKLAVASISITNTVIVLILCLWTVMFQRMNRYSTSKGHMGKSVESWLIVV